MKTLKTVYCKISSFGGYSIHDDHILRQIEFADIKVTADKSVRKRWTDDCTALGEILPDIIDVLTDDDYTMILSAHGPMEPDELIPIISFISNSDNIGRYYLPEISSLSCGRGYVYGAINFDYNREWISNIFTQKEIYFGNPCSLLGVVVPENISEEVLKMDFHNKDSIHRICELGVAFLGIYSDFTCFFIGSKMKSAQRILDEFRAKHSEEIELKVIHKT